MSDSGAKRLAWALAVTAFALYLGGLGLSLTTESGGLDSQDGFLFLIVGVFATVGVLIASSPLRNALGWIYCGVAVLAGLGALAQSYAAFWLGGGSTPLLVGQIATVYAESAWIGWVLVPATFLLLLFPNGRLLSRRWGIVAWCAGVGLSGEFLVGILKPGALEDFPEVVNPIGVEWAGLVEPVTTLLSALAILGSAISLILRFRRVTGLQRQQIKWLAYASAVAAPTVVVAVSQYEALGAELANAVIQLAILVVPIAAGIAILRYRLYDIDVVVNRTLVYGALTATLAAAYFGSVLLLQFALSPLTDRNELAVAVSTLVVAALFRPARARIQGWVDRRFYRHRFDAVRTLAEFSSRLREQVDLQALRADLRGVVRETVNPAHVSLWLPAPEVRR